MLVGMRNAPEEVGKLREIARVVGLEPIECVNQLAERRGFAAGLVRAAEPRLDERPHARILCHPRSGPLSASVWQGVWLVLPARP